MSKSRKSHYQFNMRHAYGANRVFNWVNDNIEDGIIKPDDMVTACMNFEKIAHAISTTPEVCSPALLEYVENGNLLTTYAAVGIMTDVQMEYYADFPTVSRDWSWLKIVQSKLHS